MVEFEKGFYSEQCADCRFQSAQSAAAVKRVEVLHDKEMVIIHSCVLEGGEDLVDGFAFLAHTQGVAHDEPLSAAARKAVQHKHFPAFETAFEFCGRGGQRGKSAAHSRGERDVQNVKPLFEVFLENFYRVVRGSLGGCRRFPAAHHIVKFGVRGQFAVIVVRGAHGKRHRHDVYAVFGKETFGHIRRHIRCDCKFVHNRLRVCATILPPAGSYFNRRRDF